MSKEGQHRGATCVLVIQYAGVSAGELPRSILTFCGIVVSLEF